MGKYVYTSQKQLRTAFWDMCDELGIDYKGKKTKYDTTLACTFNDWTDSLQKDGAISEKLRYKACLY